MEDGREDGGRKQHEEVAQGRGVAGPRGEFVAGGGERAGVDGGKEARNGADRRRPEDLHVAMCRGRVVTSGFWKLANVCVWRGVRVAGWACGGVCVWQSAVVMLTCYHPCIRPVDERSGTPREPGQ